MISNNHKDFFRGYVASLRFVKKTKDTCFFYWPECKFQQLFDWVKKQGVNPYEAMYW